MDFRFLGRIQRMCLKELRETLRDRRTLITLILMPLLVYPLLSLALQRLILTSAGPRHPEFIIGVRTDDEFLRLGETLGLAAHLRHADIYRPIRINRKNSKVSAGSYGSHPAEWRVMMMDDSSSKYLAEGKVDLIISINRLTSTNEPHESPVQELGRLRRLTRIQSQTIDRTRCYTDQARRDSWFQTGIGTH